MKTFYNVLGFIGGAATFAIVCTVVYEIVRLSIVGVPV